MTGPTHVVVTVTATLLLNQHTDYNLPGLWGWLALLTGALLPDIDEPRSTASNPAGLLSKLLPGWVQQFVNIPFQAASTAIRAVFGHRGATHYLLWPLLCGGVAWYFQLPWLAWFAWGYLLHLLADGLTSTGIPALGPLYRKNGSILPKFMRIKTGGPVENLLNTGCWLYLIYAVYAYF